MSLQTLLSRCTALAAGLSLATAALAQNAPPPPPAPAQPGSPANGTEQQVEESTDGKVLLAYLWKTDQPLRYRITTVEQTTTTTTSGNPLEAVTEKNVEIALRPAGKAERSRNWLEVGWERVHFKINQGKVAFEVDTAAQDNANAGVFAPMVQAMQQIKGRTVRLLMSPGGRVEQVEGFAPIVEAVKNAFPADQNRDAIVAALFPTTNEQLVEQLSKAVLPLPVKRVEPGFTAEQRVPLGQGDELTGQLVFTGVQGEGADKALVVRQEMSAQAGPPQANPADKLTYVREKFDISSTLAIDADALLPLRFESTSTTNYAARKDGSNPEAAPDKLVQQIVKVETLLLDQPPVAQEPGATGTAPPAPAPPAPPAAAEPSSPPPAVR